MSLSDALRDPDDVATLLLLELEERVEDAVVELLHERVDVQLHLNRMLRSVEAHLVTKYLENVPLPVANLPTESLLILTIFSWYPEQRKTIILYLTEL